MIDSLRNLVRRYRLNKLQRPFNNLSRAEVFDLIYRNNTWGQSTEGIPYSGTGTHFPDLADPYVEMLNNFLATLEKPSVVDLGCGDYAIGRRLNCSSYVGCDVSEVVLESNRAQFPDVDFRAIDIVTDPLPDGEIATVRQVLQHLDNDSILGFISRSLPYSYLVVTESVPQGEFSPNVDKPVGPNVRPQLNSGVILHRAPFNFSAPILSEMDVPGLVGPKPHFIRTTIYDLT